ncbi:SMP-30/gluconolactonase/LRE family protein [Tamlana sp. s12]|uniref:SMP-30/gluconolactonase/LRE family protein n=1 Tax=Tamlana sp. s12 TaxID=1630406 RepID=UPI000802326B|nr:SMP-30/gluconolactonase/LRE family protein [Tamlana sp. s12]OBQ55492.1 hypothetical protein VQ01_08530 [Tamlana sp. s12]QQY83842.1 SMP-30/gluconolactonase/LRE family protein [Tamlana sp. s12]
MKLQLLLVTILFSSIQSFSQPPVKLSSGQFNFIEGPVWDRNDHIYFSDVGTRKVEVYTVSTKSFSTAFTSNVRTNGLMFDKNMNLVVCEFQGGQITEKSTSGTLQDTYATGFTNPNDLCIDKKGGVYVTDPNVKEVYYLSPGTTKTKTLIDNSIEFPNGVIISNDGKTLFVSDSNNYDIIKFDIDLNTGLISNKSVFATLTDTDNSEPKSLADGMALDTDGNLYVAAKKSIQIFDTSGTLINTINFTENPTNCTFGGASLNTLYVTTPNDFYKIDFSGVTGFQHPFDLPETSLSVNEKSKDFQFKTFPNPTYNHQIKVAVGENEITEITLYNNVGQKIKSYDFKKTSNIIDINLDPNLKANLYILTIKTADGNMSSSKILVQ